MQICSKKHAEVCYEGEDGQCPLCDALGTIRFLRNEVDILNDDIDKLGTKKEVLKNETAIKT